MRCEVVDHELTCQVLATQEQFSVLPEMKNLFYDAIHASMKAV